MIVNNVYFYGFVMIYIHLYIRYAGVTTYDIVYEDEWDITSFSSDKHYIINIFHDNNHNCV